MAVQTWTFGRIGLETAAGGDGLTLAGHYPVQYAGDEVRIEADLPADSVTDMRALRDQFRGYDLNPDEPVIPITSEADPTVNGFYRVNSVSVDDNVSTHFTNGLGSRVVTELLRVPGWQAPLFEVVCGGADRSNGHSVASQARSWVAGPGSLDSASLNVVTTTNTTLSTAVRSVKVWTHDGNLYDGSLTYQVNESGFYDGACWVEVDHAGNGNYQVVTGRQVQNLVGRWRLTNGLVRVYPGGSEVASQGLDCPGSSGDYTSTPDSADYDPSSSVSASVRVSPDSLTPGSTQTLMSKWSTGQKSYSFRLNSAGKLEMATSADGSAEVVVASTLTLAAMLSANGITATEPFWIAGAWNSGFGGSISFGVSGDDTNTASAVTFTQYPTGAGAASIFAGSAVLAVGAESDGTSPFAGTIHSAAAYVDSVYEAAPNFADAAQFTIAAATGTDPQGNTWTHQGNADVAATALGGTVDDYAVDIYDPTAAEWQTKVYNITTGGSTPTSLGVAKALTINANRPEIATVRIHTNAVGAPFIDWTLRRGSPVVEGRVEHSHTAATNRAFGVFRKIVEAGSSLASGEGIEAASDDADGHKYRIYSPNAITVDTTNGGVYLTTAADALKFGITTDARDGDTTTGGFYWAAQNHNQQIVAR